ncbi:MAG: hypothetical protein IJN05_12090 [Ruminococcus sp.]|nr:hypothetical protein [Ruminococcus sp.]
MEITLIKAIKGNEVHGSDNPRRTGCGINLTKPENISRYITNGTMSDLNEINCEKCKMILAKRMIKADRKEMKNMIKEEKMRAKKGLGDENIVPLGGTQSNSYLPDAGSRRPTAVPMPSVRPTVTATTTINKSEPFSSQPMPAAVQPITPAPAPVSPVQNTAPAPVQPQPAPTGFNNSNFVNNDFMNSFAIPKQEAPQPQPAPVKNTAPVDDILSQFAIPKQEAPQEQPAPVQNTVPVNNDVLSQFAIPAPQNNAFDEPKVEKDAPFDIDAALAQFAIPPTNKPADTLIPEPPKNVATNIDDALAQFSIPAPQTVAQPEPVQEVKNEAPKPFDIDDALRQFSIPVPNTSAPEAEVIGDEPKATNPYENNDVIEIENLAPVAEEAVPTWDTVADQLFSADTPAVEEIAPIAQETVAPVIEEIAPVAQEVVAPVIEEIAPVAQEAVAPVIEEIAPIAEEVAAPVIEEIAPIAQETVAPVIEEIAPTVEEVAAPAIEETPAPTTVIEETVTTTSSQPVENASPEVNKYQYTTPFADEAPKQEQNENLHVYTPPVFPDEPVAPQMAAPQPMQAAPVAPTVPVQPVAPQSEAQTMMGAPIIPNANQAVNPVPQQTVPFTAPVPQIMGYDANGQPIYAYVQQQFMGYDANGQPLFAPVQMPMMNMQPNLASFGVNPNAAAPVAPAQPIAPQPAPMAQPVVQPVPPMAQPVQPAPYQPSQIHLSKVDEGKMKNMPDAVASAVAKSRGQQNKNIFDMQGIAMPVIDSIEGALSQMGEDVRTKQEIIDSNTSTPVFEEYKAPPKMNYNQQPRSSAPNKENRPLSRADIKNLKKQEKIDAKFKKELAKRGF